MIGNKILIIGCSGAGKSYFARQLNELSNIPLYYLDCIFWKENWTHITRDELLEETKKIMEKPSWIIDGNYLKTLEERFKEADTIFFLDLPQEDCIKAEALRRGTKRPDLPDYLVEEYDPEFIDFIKSFKSTKRPIILSLMDKYKDKIYYTFKSRQEKDLWLDKYAKYLSSKI